MKCDGCKHEPECRQEVCLYDFYVKGNNNAYKKIADEIKYIINSGMGKQKALEHILKICEAEQIKEESAET